MGLVEILLLSIVVYKVYSYFAWQRRKQQFMYKVQKIMDADDIKILNCTIEKHNELMYLWEADTGRFLTQGSTMEEIKTKFEQDFPKMNFVVKEE